MSYDQSPTSFRSVNPTVRIQKLIWREKCIASLQMNISSLAAGFSTGDLCQVRSDYDSDLATLDSGSLSRSSAFGAVFRELLPQTKDRHVNSDSDQKDEDSPQESRTHVVAVHNL